MTQFGVPRWRDIVLLTSLFTFCLISIRLRGEDFMSDILKDDFLCVLRRLSTLMFKSILSLTPECNANRCYLLRTTYLVFEPFQLSSFFQQFHWFLQLQSCFITWYEKERDKKFRALCIVKGGCLETLNSLHERICEIFTFCDVLHETNTWNKTKNANMYKLSWVRSTN